MGDRRDPSAGAAGRAPAAGRPEDIRNVVLVGPGGSGKTTLALSLALAAGAVDRAGRAGDGGPALEQDGADHHRQRSAELSLVPVEWGGIKINLLDTPGDPDFVGELRAGLRAADAALFVVSAADGVNGATRPVWDECAAVGMPRAVVITHPEAARADFQDMAAACARVLGGDRADTVLPLHPPVRGAGTGDGRHPVTGLAGLLTRTVYDYTTGTRTERGPHPGELPLIEEARDRLIEAVIAGSEDEALLDRYLEGAGLDSGILLLDLGRAVARGGLHPVLVAAPPAEGSRLGLGTVELLEFLTGAFPAPSERPAPPVTTLRGAARPPLSCDPGGPLAAEVVKTGSDPYVGRISLVRVFSGTLRPDQDVHVAGHGLEDRGHEDHDADLRTGALSSSFGGHPRIVPRCVAGDLTRVARLATAETGDTLSGTEDPLLIRPWEMPVPLLPVAIEAHSGSDEDKLSPGLARLIAEDPSLRVEHDPDTRQLVLWCLGEVHASVALARLRDHHGVRVDTVPHRVALRETFGGKATGHGRYVKQSGGHGQFAICDIEVEPLPEGSGVQFEDKVVGGSVPRRFVPSVEKGVRAQAARGVALGHPVVDIRVTLTDGRAHSVDSSDAAFQNAGALALREAAAEARIDLLEPVLEVEIEVPDDYVGPVMSDLSGHRGRVLGTGPTTPGRTAVRAEAPEAEIDRYAVELRSHSHGTGRFRRSYARHEKVPPRVAVKSSGRKEPEKVK